MVFHKGCSAVQFAFGTGCKGVSWDLEVGSIFVAGLLQAYGSHCVSLHEVSKNINLHLC